MSTYPLLGFVQRSGLQCPELDIRYLSRCRLPKSTEYLNLYPTTPVWFNYVGTDSSYRQRNPKWNQYLFFATWILAC